MNIAVIGIAALLAWVITALGGFVMLGRWISRAGLRQQRSGATRFPAGLVFSHFGLAAGGLVVWIAYLLSQIRLAWVAFVLLIPVALLGFIMLVRWIPVYRGRAVTASAQRASSSAGSDRWRRSRPSGTCRSRSSSRTACSPRKKQPNSEWIAHPTWTARLGDPAHRWPGFLRPRRPLAGLVVVVVHDASA